MEKKRVFRVILDILIVLSVAATLVEEAAIVTGAPWRARALAQSACVVLDLVFFLELAARSCLALLDRKIASWFRDEAGWVDCMASVLPIVFMSGPFLFDSIVGLSSTSMIAAMGNFRLLRGLGLLRLLRLLRLFNPDKSNASSRGRPLVRAGTFAICASLLVLVGAEAASILGLWPDAHEALARKRLVTLQALASNPGADAAEGIAMVDSDLLLVREAGDVVYTRHSAEQFRRSYGPDEIGYLRTESGLEAFFSLRGELRAQAAATLSAGLCAVAVLASLALAAGGRNLRQPGEPAPAMVSHDSKPGTGEEGIGLSAERPAVPSRPSAPPRAGPAGMDELDALLKGGSGGKRR